MKDLIYQVSVGRPTRLYQFCQDTIAKYAKRIGADRIVQTGPILKIAPNPRRTGRSMQAIEPHGCLIIFEKENAFDLLGNYDRVAIIDSDIWVRPDAPNLFEELGDADFAGVRERDMPSVTRHRRKMKRFSQMMFGPLRDVDWDWDLNGSADFHNMGLMLMGNNFKDFLRGESAKEFLARPEFRDFIDGVGHFKWSTDQTLLNWWVRKCGMKIRNLDWKWNALYSAIPDERAREAHMVHFFLRDKLPEKGENVEELERAIT